MIGKKEERKENGMDRISQRMRALAPEWDPLRLGTGWKKEDLGKVQILIESTFGDSHPGSGHLDRLAEAMGESHGTGVWSDAAAVKRNMVYLFTWDETREFVESLFMGCHSEVCYVLLLDSRHGLIDYRKMDGGTDNSIAVSPNWVASYMYEKHAAGVILAHNHPISRAEPSGFDATFTERVAMRLHALGGALYDHIIVGETETCSWVHDPRRFIRLDEGVFSEFYPSTRKDH